MGDFVELWEEILEFWCLILSPPYHTLALSFKLLCIPSLTYFHMSTSHIMSHDNAKTKIILVSNQNKDKPCIMYNNEPLCVESLKYLGLLVLV